jgi:alcohol dehydrogenase class IV
MVENLRNFSFSKIPQIIFGAGTSAGLGKLAAIYGKRTLLVTGTSSYNSTFIKERIEKSLDLKNLEYLSYAISGEPSPTIIDQATSMFRKENIDVVIAIGGGSVMDAGKAIAAMLITEGTVFDYLEGVGTKTPPGIRLPLIAVPTTSGTGSEATKNAVISRFGKNGFKRSFRHDNYVPDYAVIDPELVLSCPQNTTAASGMDAFTQLLESYISTEANPLNDALAFSGLEHIARSIKRAFENGNDIDARTDMAYAALISGITLSNGGLGIIHGYAQPLGSLFPIPHGIVCGSLMGIVNQFTILKLRKENPGSIFLDKYSKIGRLFSKESGKNEDYYIDCLIDTIHSYIEEFKFPKLSLYGVNETSLNDIISRTGLKNHPVNFTSEELKEILRARL